MRVLLVVRHFDVVDYLCVLAAGFEEFITKVIFSVLLVWFNWFRAGFILVGSRFVTATKEIVIDDIINTQVL